MFQFMPIASCPIAQHRGESGSILLAPTLQTLTYTGRVDSNLCLDEELDDFVRPSLNLFPLIQWQTESCAVLEASRSHMVLPWHVYHTHLSVLGYFCMYAKVWMKSFILRYLFTEAIALLAVSCPPRDIKAGTWEYAVPHKHRALWSKACSGRNAPCWYLVPGEKPFSSEPKRHRGTWISTPHKEHTYL